jgi:hypothetical protein
MPAKPEGETPAPAGADEPFGGAPAKPEAQPDGGAPAADDPFGDAPAKPEAQPDGGAPAADDPFGDAAPASDENVDPFADDPENAPADDPFG